MKQICLLLSGFLVALACSHGEEQSSSELTRKDKVAIMQLARNEVLRHFELDGETRIPAEQLKRLGSFKEKVFVLFRYQGKSRGCWSSAGGTLPENIGKAVRNTLNDDRYSGTLERKEAARTRIEVFVLRDGIELPDKSVEAFRAGVVLGVDSVQVTGEARDRSREATFLNYVPITSGYGNNPERMLDRLCLKAKLGEVAVPALAEDLSHQDATVRWQAFLALGQVGKHKKVTVLELVRNLQVEDPSIRRWAAEALSVLGPDAKTATGALGRTLVDREAPVRAAGAMALGRIGKDAESAVPDLVRLLGDGEGSVRAAAAKAILGIDPRHQAIPRGTRLQEIATKGGGPRSPRVPDAKAGVLARAVLKHPSVKLYRVPTVHLLESPYPDHVIEPYRCNTFVPARKVDRESVTESIELCGRWFLASMRWDGAMEYQWFVNSREYSSSNNMIRQWMATIALWDLFQFTGDTRYREAAKRNLAYNIRAYYEAEPSKNIGYIHFRGKAKLGSAGFALRAILSIDEEERYSHQLERLRNFLLVMQKKDGSFHTIYYPAKKSFEASTKLQRYYAGEALLAIVKLYEKTKDGRLLQAVERAFPYYRSFFDEDQHPAAIPWLTQAYYRAYLVNNNPDYVDFVFKMNDFMLKIQNTTGRPQPDMLGRFHAPDRPEYGPPLSASTGVYVEGLVDAYRMARLSKDTDREDAYRQGVILGIRSLMQLQFRNDNLFFAQDRFRTQGGIRGHLLSTTIRMDYVQHATQGMIRAVQSLEGWVLSAGAADGLDF